jgi:Domain of unknown function (DUF6894)
MPRYFFDVRDGQDIPDVEGVELADRDAAHREAFHTAGEMLKEADRKFLQGDVWEMHVTDEAGKTVCRLRFSAEDCD